MISEHLLEELRQLNRMEKLRVMQLLANQIAEEEEILTGTEFEGGRLMMPPVRQQF